MAYTLNSNINMKNRDNSPGGSKVYLAEWQNVSAVAIDANGIYCSGITMSGTTKFYQYDMPRENITFANNTDISVPNGVFIYKPFLSFNLPGLSGSTLNMFDTLVRKPVVAIVKTNMGTYFIIGKDNGLDMTPNSKFDSGKSGVDLVGATIELEGLEASRIYQLDPATAETIMTSIVSAS